jgi:peptidyl-prolyl cis-trans isomerase SurA
MKRRATQTVLLITFLMVMMVHAGKVIDAVIVTVNGMPLMQSDLEIAIRFESLAQQRPPDAPLETKPALDRLVDQELLRQQMQGALRVPAKEIEDRLRDLRSLYPDSSDDATWAAVLARYGLTNSEVRERIDQQLQILHIMDLRLRPNVVVDNDAVAAYYRESLEPKARQMNARLEPLDELAPKIRELLVQQKMDTLLTAWLANLRSQSKIHVTHPSAPVVSLQTSRERLAVPPAGGGAR